ncbi:hypothetical protein QE443_000369 [Pantoea ananatis]|nr:hypothetical protein [Pantoea ananatis]MDR6090062.1 hypothetical protein [Pantoea ananatis]
MFSLGFHTEEANIFKFYNEFLRQKGQKPLITTF